MAEQNITLFKKHEKVYPRDTWGRYRIMKWMAMITLLSIYYFFPFIRFDRGPGVPDQAILIDMVHRRAYFFWIEIWPQEVYYLAGILILAAVGLFFVTSLLGRVWCGYACFQTVWTDLFIKIEHWVQGDRNARIKLDKGPWTFEKVWKKLLTHALWIFIGLCTGGAWVLYFNDAPTLVRQALDFNLSPNVMTWILALTASTYIMAGFAREHVCTFMCPYARFQSAMFDRDTLIIGYDVERGEPRGAHKQGDSWEGRGDCVDCGQCVHVCPTGIDIRNGLQLQCIACGLCVDACNAVMDKVGRPRGLVRYDTENNMIARGMAKSAGRVFRDRLRLLRPRTIYYTLILSLVAGLMVYSLAHRSVYDLHVLHERNPLYVRLSSGDIRNSFTIKILNKTHQAQSFTLSASGMEGAALSVVGGGNTGVNNLPVAADAVADYRVTVAVPDDNNAASRRSIVFTIKNNASGETHSTESMFVMRD